MKKLVLFSALVVIISASACSGLPGAAPTSTPTRAPTPTRQPSPTPLPTATPVPPTPTPDPAANPQSSLLNAFQNWKGVKSFRAKTTTTTAAKATTETTMEMVMPDRFHVISKSSETIKIGTDLYLKTGNTWRKVTLTQGVDFSSADVKKLETELGISTETKFIGSEILDGTPTFVYQYVTTIKTPTSITTTSKVWVAVADGLPRKRESATKTGIKTVTIYSDYNTNIVIEPPIK